MTAHPPKLATVTPALVEAFGRYYRDQPAWGIFHVWLADGNYKHPFHTNHHTDDEISRHGRAVTNRAVPAAYIKEVRALAVVFSRLSPSQREKLGKKAEWWARQNLPFGAGRG